MKPLSLLIFFLCVWCSPISAQHISYAQKEKYNNVSTDQIGSSVLPGCVTNRNRMPLKRNLFKSTNAIWKWDTILCYNKTSDLIPFQRVPRTYNSYGEALTNLYERREGSMNWDNYARETFSYDSSGNWVFHLQERWQNNSWVNQRKQEFIYDASGNQIDWKIWSWNSSVWKKDGHYWNHFNSIGLNDTSIYQVGQDSLWVNCHSYKSSYDANNHLTSVLAYTWTNNGWVYDNLSTWTYNANGYSKSLLEQNWVNTVWQNSLFYQYTRDTAGRILINFIQDWQNSAWVNSSQMISQYDSLGNRILSLTEFWQNNVWVDISRVMSVYDPGCNLLSQMTQGWENTYWRNQDYRQYTYDSSGNSLTGKYLWWYQNSWQSENGNLDVLADHQRDIVLQDIYRYEALVDSILVSTNQVKTTAEVQLFPNPAHSTVYVAWPNEKGLNRKLTLYDLTGNIVFSRLICDNRTPVDISNLVPGVYVMMLQDDKFLKVVKFVKD